MLKRILYLLIFVLAVGPLFAQVTTSSVSGTVKSASGENLVGATVTATHQPTGTIFRATSLKEGVYSLVNLIPGGPYSITASFVGYQNFTQDSVILPLGENTRIDVSLSTTSATL